LAVLVEVAAQPEPQASATATGSVRRIGLNMVDSFRSGAFTSSTRGEPARCRTRPRLCVPLD